MTSVVIEATGEVVEQMTAVEAERITARIADKLDAIADNLEQVLPLIGEALTRDAWKALGYASPTAYVSERFAGALTRLSPDVRRPVVTQLSQAGMSTRAIAPVVGASQKTVDRDVRAESFDSPELTPRVSSATSPATAPSAETPAPAPRITGMDGKQYSRPVPAPQQEQVAPKPRAEAITAQFSAAVVELNKVLDRLHRIQSNPNFPANKNQVATLHGNDLARAVSELQNLADQLH